MTGILFIARMGSTRLHRKHLIQVEGKTFLEWMILRYAGAFQKEISKGQVRLIIATSNLPQNKKFEEYILNLPVSLYYGNDQNIPLRQLGCAKALGLDNIISIDGDDILCSATAAKRIYEELVQSQAAIVKSSGLPLGMNCMGYSTTFLTEALEGASTEVLETGWGRIFEMTLAKDIKFECDPASLLRMTLDYSQDAEFFKTVISYFGSKIISVSDKELVSTIVQKKFYKINYSLHEEYWENFTSKMQAEKLYTPAKENNNSNFEEDGLN